MYFAITCVLYKGATKKKISKPFEVQLGLGDIELRVALKGCFQKRILQFVKKKKKKRKKIKHFVKFIIFMQFGKYML